VPAATPLILGQRCGQEPWSQTRPYLLLFGGFGSLLKRLCCRGALSAGFTHLFFAASGDTLALGVDVGV